MSEQLELVRIGALNEASPDILVQVDKNMSLNVMYKVMSICGRQGYTDMKFAVMMRDQ
jgi:biopolymer transport protein ExbD